MKLSEIKDNEMLIADNELVYKKEIIDEWHYFRDLDIYTVKQYKASIDAQDMLEDAIEIESDNMYEDWNLSNDIKEEDIKELQVIVDRILSRSSNVAYIPNEKVEIDIVID